MSIGFSLAWRQPLVFFWTIPGTVLVGPALGHLTFPEVVGAYIATGLLMLALGALGLVRRAMAAVPMPIVMGMVAGVFLQFGLDWVRAFQADLVIAAAMTAVFLARQRRPAAGGAPAADAGRAGRRRCRDLARRHASRRASTRPACSAAPVLQRAAILLGRDGRAGGAARHHRAGGAERPGHRRADGCRPRPPVNAIAVGCGVASIVSRVRRRGVDLPHRPGQRHHLRAAARSARSTPPASSSACCAIAVRPVRAAGDAADAGDAAGLHRHAGGPRHAQGAADGVHRVLPGRALRWARW